jgi:hypothetical protein
MKQIILFVIFICSCGFSAYSQSPVAACPEIMVTGPATTVQPGDDMNFYVTVGNRLTSDYKYRWTINGGFILNGQDTSMIRVGTGGLANLNITASVMIGGLPEGCANSASKSGSILPLLQREPIDRFGKSTIGVVRAYLDSFLIGLINNPGSKGLIELRLNKNWSYSQKYYFVKLRYDHLVYRKIDKTRVTFSVDLSGGYDEEETMLLMAPPEAEFPGQDDKNIRFIKAEDMSKELGRLFKKAKSH